MRGSGGLLRFFPPPIMTGAGIKRYHPDPPRQPQRGKGLNRFLHGVVGDAVSNFAQGYHKSGQPDAVAAIQSGYKSVKRGTKRSLRNQARKGVAKKARTFLNDIFGK